MFMWPLESALLQPFHRKTLKLPRFELIKRIRFNFWKQLNSGTEPRYVSLFLICEKFSTIYVRLYLCCLALELLSLRSWEKGLRSDLENFNFDPVVKNQRRVIRIDQLENFLGCHRTVWWWVIMQGSQM